MCWQKILKTPRCRQVVQCLRGGYRISERRACGVIRLQRGTYRYQSQKDPRTELRMRMREIATVRVRYGYRKILVLLQREGWAVGKTMVSRLYREEGLALRRTGIERTYPPNEQVDLSVHPVSEFLTFVRPKGP